MITELQKPQGSVRPAWILTGLYLLANGLIAWATAPGANLAEAADGASWYEPAVALLRHGAFVELNDPTQPQTYRPPMFPLFAAGAMLISGGQSPVAIVVAQIVALMLTGLIVRHIAQGWCPGRENIAFALTLFSPNALSNAHLVQSDTLFTLFVVLFVGVLAGSIRRGIRLRHALYAGVTLGAACLTRPTPQYMILLLPVLLPALVWLGVNRKDWRRAFGMGLVATAIALVVVLPWAFYLQAAGKGLTLSSPEIEYRYVWDQVQMIEAQHHGLSYADAGRALESPGGVIDRFVTAQGAGWEGVDPSVRWRQLTGLGYDQFFSYPLAAHLKTWSRSQLQFFFAAGAGNFHNLFGIDAGAMSRGWLGTDQSDPLSVFRAYIGSSGMAGLAISTLTFAYVITIRLLDIAGLVAMVARRQWPALLMTFAIVGYFAIIHIYVGNSRYRLAVDPLLFLMATIGIDALLRRMARQPIVAA